MFSHEYLVSSNQAAGPWAHLMSYVGLRPNEITLINNTDRPLIVYVSPSQGLKLVALKVVKKMTADAGQAGVAAGKANIKLEEEYEAPPASIRTTEKKMPAKKPGQRADEKKVFVDYELNGVRHSPAVLYLTVVEYENDRYKFITEEVPIQKLSTYTIKQEHLELADSLPCKFTRNMPKFENGLLVDDPAHVVNGPRST